MSHLERRERLMQRTLVSPEDLLKWLNSQLSNFEECTNCHFNPVQELREENEQGCNWSLPWLICSGVSTRVCQPIANRIVAQARGKFNVKWPGVA